MDAEKSSQGSLAAIFQCLIFLKIPLDRYTFFTVKPRQVQEIQSQRDE